MLVNDDLREASFGLKDRLDAVDLELKDVRARLSRLYYALETGKLGMDDLAPRIRGLRARQDELSKSRVQLEADMVVEGVHQVDINVVRAYAEDLRNLLEEADFVERKAFLRSFIKRVEISGTQVTVRYKIPMPAGRELTEAGVLPIETPGGAGGIRTPYLCDANATFSRVNYGPARISL